MRTLYVQSIMFAYFGMLLSAIQQFVTVPFAVQLFGESGYGIYATYFALASGLAGLMSWVAAASAPVLSKSIHQNRDSEATALYQTLKYLHILFALALVSLGLLAFHYTSFLTFTAKPNTHLVFYSSLLFSACLIVTGVEPTVIFSAGRTDLLNKYRFFAQLLTLALVLLVLVLFPALSLLFVASSIGCLALLLLCRSGIRSANLAAFRHSRAQFSPQFKPLLMKFTSLAGATSGVRTLVMLDPVLIALLLGAESVTFFTYYWLPANFIILALWKFSENAQPLFMKAFADKNLAGGKSIYRRISLVLLSVGSTSALLYLALIPHFHAYWVDYHDSSILMASIFAVYIVCAGAYRLDFAVLYANMQFKSILKLSIIELVCKVAGTVILLNQFHFGSSIAAHAVAHLLILRWYAKYLVKNEFLETS